MGATRIAVGVLCASMLGLSSPAWAQKWLKSFDVGSVHAENASYNGGFGPNAGLVMGPSITSSFTGSFMVPPEYTPGTPLYVGVSWHTNAATPCGIHLAPNFISVARIGRTHIQGTGSATSGLEPLDGSLVLSATAANTTDLKVYTITSPDGTTNLQPFDTINFGLFRRPTDSGDTCEGNLIIQGLVVAVLD